MPDSPRTYALASRLAVGELKRRGLDPGPLLLRAGLSFAAIGDDDARVPYLKQAVLLEDAARLSGEPNFGLTLATRLDPRDLGAIGYLGLSSQTLGDALYNLERYLAIVTAAFRIEVSVAQDRVIILLVPSEASLLLQRQAAECSVGFFVRNYQFLTQDRINPIDVRFCHDFKGPAGVHEGHFGCPVQFGRKRCEIVYRRSDLATRISTSDDRLLKILQAHCDTLLARQDPVKPDLILRLERSIVALLPAGRAKASIVASELGMSERSLVRHLADLETSFSRVLSGIRHELAHKYLRERDLSLSQVAFLLGYSNQSAFSAAFRRATGHAPREIRRAGDEGQG